LTPVQHERALRVPLDAPRSTVADGPLPVRALVNSDCGELAGEVLLWVDNGCLSGLELAWYTDEAPTGWPSAAQLVQA
jgi:hypothetical protein